MLKDGWQFKLISVILDVYLMWIVELDKSQLLGESARTHLVNYKYFCQKLNLRKRTKDEGYIIQIFCLTDQMRAGQVDGNHDPCH